MGSNRSRRSVMVETMSSLARAWMILAAGGTALSGLSGCSYDEQIARLQTENEELRKELVKCEFARTEAKTAALQCELEHMAVKYGGPPVRTGPVGSEEGSKPVAPDGGCKCVEGDPLCNCL